MSESQEKIIVFDAYDTVMQANLVKTKLDAYGIPCFLTDENFTTWYPFRNDLFPGVRLHIFETDTAQVKEILASVDPIQCPHCHASHVTYEETGKLSWWQALALFFVITPRKRVYYCHDCEREFGVE